MDRNTTVSLQRKESSVQWTGLVILPMIRRLLDTKATSTANLDECNRVHTVSTFIPSAPKRRPPAKPLAARAFVADAVRVPRVAGGVGEPVALQVCPGLLQEVHEVVHLTKMDRKASQRPYVHIFCPGRAGARLVGVSRQSCLSPMSCAELQHCSISSSVAKAAGKSNMAQHKKNNITMYQYEHSKQSN